MKPLLDRFPMTPVAQLHFHHTEQTVRESLQQLLGLVLKLLDLAGSGTAGSAYETFRPGSGTARLLLELLDLNKKPQVVMELVISSLPPQIMSPTNRLAV